MKPYIDYKYSGVEWLEFIPAHWDVVPLKHWVKINAEVLPVSTDPTLTFTYLDIGSVGTGILTEKPKRVPFGEAPSRARRVVTLGDTLVSTVRTYLKAVYSVRAWDGLLICSTGFAVLSPDGRTDPRFLGYMAQSNTFANRITTESVGTAYPAIAETRLGSLRIPLPPLPEQAAIARFLDYVDRRIRRLVQAKEKLVGLLEELRASTISEAVTGQIDVRTGQPYLAYKSSGIAWLGQIPAHWEVVPLKHWVQINARVLPKATDPVLAFSYLDIGSVGTGMLIEAPKKLLFGGAPSRARRVVKQGDTLVSTVRTYLKAVYSVQNSDGLLICSTGLAVLSPNNHTDSRFVGYSAQSKGFTDRVTAESVGIAYPAIAETRLGALPAPIPLMAEQTAIAEYLDRATFKITKAIANTRREIELLQEYRTRMIADVVTGKLDVREAAARLPEVDILQTETSQPGREEKAALTKETAA